MKLDTGFWLLAPGCELRPPAHRGLRPGGVTGCWIWMLIKLIVFIKLIKLELQNSQAFALHHLLPNQLFNLIN
jgi:hypothetical protein